MILMIDEEVMELQRIMTEGLLFPVFQPILDFRVRAILGYESLMRGPADSLCIGRISFLARPRGMD